MTVPHRAGTLDAYETPDGTLTLAIADVVLLVKAWADLLDAGQPPPDWTPADTQRQVATWLRTQADLLACSDIEARHAPGV